jgi:hypothetical protein
VWTVCPNTGTSSTVMHTRKTFASVPAAGTVTLRFVVFVP